MQHNINQRTQTTAESGAKSLFFAFLRPWKRLCTSPLAILAVLVAGPMLAQPATHTARFSAADFLVRTSEPQIHQASVIDDIIDVIEEIIDELTDEEEEEEEGGTP